ncbi:MAG: alanine racemase [Pseudomonadales bacterium]
MSARLLVDLAALRANYRALCAVADEVAAVVKADAYGCGVGPIAQTLADAGCKHFFVATCAEALALRRVLPQTNIYVFEGPLADTAAALAAAAIVPVVNHEQQLQHWAPFREHAIAVAVDTGMARLGFDPQDLQPELLRGFLPVLLLTHFACADEPDDDLNAQQLARFAKVQARFPDLPVSLGNSAATLSAQVPTLGLARPGIALYGGAPFVHADSRLAPVAALQGQILQIRRVAAGASVGYGATWSPASESRVAIVGLGYADGLRRTLSNLGSAIVAGQRVPIVGRISMDLTHLDVTQAQARVGDWVEFFGPQLAIGEVSALLQTIDYEVLTSIGSRVRRIYSDPTST